MRLLLEPANNTLSHLAKCLALRDAMERRGHEVVLTASASRSAFFRRLGAAHEILPDVQDADGAASPTFAWFRPERLEAVVRAEVDLIRRVRPDRVLGVFRFTGPLSARLAGVPYDSLVCGCMTPACDETLGFAPGEPGEEGQREALAFFRRAGAARLRPALARLGLGPVEDLWSLQLGERTFLWDAPEFQPLRPLRGVEHVGPIRFEGWPFDERAAERYDALRAPVAVVSFGTSGGHRRAAERMVEALRRLGFSVALAGGGQAGDGWPAPGPTFAAFDFLPVEHALATAALVATHGGQGVVLESLRRRVPVLVLPFQPEQAQNGRCVERLGCGLRLVRGEVFLPDAVPAEEVFLARLAAGLDREIRTLLADPGLPARLDAAARAIDRTGGLDALVEGLERGA